MPSLAEYFLLREAASLATRIPDTERKEANDALRLGRQKADAAEALWANGHAAEALRLAIEALRETVAAVPMLPSLARSGADSSEGVPSWQSILTQHGLQAEKVRALAEAERAAREASLPKYDADLKEADAALFEATLKARSRIERALGHSVHTPKQIAWTRVTRIGTAVLGSVLVLVAIVLWARTPERATARASDTFAGGTNFVAAHAVDGDPATEWLLSDRQSGWVEASYSRPRHVSKVRVRNAVNAPYHDRATREYRIELYSGETLVGTAEGVFADARNAGPQEHAFDHADVDRVRFVVRSHHGLGGGLAELEVEN